MASKFELGVQELDPGDVPDWVPRRQKLWQIGGGMQCSIVGTCLAHDDLLRIARKCGTKLADGISGYDIHGYFVKEASRQTPVAEALQKLLDKRYAKLIRQLDLCRSDAEREQLWNAEYEAGRVAGAYWTFLTNTRVSQSLLTRIFGEVHMLSHVQGRVAHKGLQQLSELQANIDHLEHKLARMSERNRHLACERDKAVAERAQIGVSAAVSATAIIRQSASHGGEGRVDELKLRLERKERALIAARERARGAEQSVRRLGDKLERLTLLLSAKASKQQRVCPVVEACAEALQADNSRRVLYLGGRTGMIEPLRRAAADARAEFVHHDGGLEQAFARIESLIESCDAVFCPIDCISHAACIRAKALCKKLHKPFVPLRSSGAATFIRALETLQAD